MTEKQARAIAQIIIEMSLGGDKERAAQFLSQFVPNRSLVWCREAAFNAVGKTGTRSDRQDMLVQYMSFQP